MASIGVGGGSGKRPVDHEIPLVPFIDLLLCCIMFLLITAVWSQMSALGATLPDATSQAAPPSVDAEPPVVIRVMAEGVRVATSDGVSLDARDVAALRDAVRALSPDRAVLLSADDGVTYARLIDTMDVLAAEGLRHVSVGDLPL